MSRAFKELGLDATPLAAATPAFCTSIPAGELRGICEQARARKARLVALWGSDETTRRAGHALHLALAFPAGLLWVSVPLSREDRTTPESPTSTRARTACSAPRPIYSGSSLPRTPTGASGCGTEPGPK